MSSTVSIFGKAESLASKSIVLTVSSEDVTLYGWIS